MAILDRFRLDGQIALVTGYRRGIGRAIAAALAEADDLKSAAVFLTSATSDYVHGATLLMDGGWMGR